MFNPFIILYGIFIIIFLLCAAAVVYHLVKYQLNRRVTYFTTTLFLVGAGILLLVNLIIATQISWGQFGISF